MGKNARVKRQARLKKQNQPRTITTKDHPSAVIAPGYRMRALNRADSTELSAANQLVIDAGLASSDLPIGPRSFPGELTTILRQLNYPGLPAHSVSMFDLVVIEESTGALVGVAHTRVQAEMLVELIRTGIPIKDAMDTITLIKLAVSPEHRDQGLGHALTQETILLTAAAGYRHLTGYADGDVSALQAFYSAARFETGPLDGPYPVEVFGPLITPVLSNPREGGFFFWKDLRR